VNNTILETGRTSRTVLVGALSAALVAGRLFAADTALTPRTAFEGSPVLEFDFPGMKIGIAEYAEGPTGVTVFHFPTRVMATVDVRGGSPGTTGTDALRLGYDVPFVDAIAFAGSSSYGLEAVDGVRSELLRSQARNAVRGNIASVSGAIIYDFTTRNNTVHADRELGSAALNAARPNRFYQGARGAGRSAAVGKYFGAYFLETAGQGGAFRQIGPTKLAVFTVVNARGNIVDRSGRVVRGNRDPETGQRSAVGDDLLQGRAADMRSRAARAAKAPVPAPKGTNTTLTLVVTNQKLSYWELQRLAVQTHTAMGRAIQPFQTRSDGDVLFAVTTAEVTNPDLDPADLATYAGELAWDAVLKSF
jgi:L-aminopeptidase/D-esterase-like protein